MGNSELKLIDNKILFCKSEESKIILDFNDKYKNLCAMPREAQNKLYSQIEVILKQSGLSDERVKMDLLIHAILFRFLSSNEKTLKVVLIGDDLLLQVAAQYADQFNSKNIGFTLTIDDEYDKTEMTPCFLEYLEQIGEESEYLCDLILISDAVIQDDEQILSKINGLLTYKGRVLVYRVPKDRKIFNDFSLLEKYEINENNIVYLLESNKALTMNEKQSEIKKLIKKSMDFIQLQWREISNSVEENQLADENSYTDKIDAIIILTVKLEKIIIENYDIFLNRDLKYEINELKNALLDLRYVSKNERIYFIDSIDNLLNELNLPG